MLKLLNRIYAPVEKLSKSDIPSFFEIMTALAFMHFADVEVDIAVIETGLGGRLDSTNVLKPKLVGITSLSIDHQQQLGQSLSSIAAEKAYPGTLEVLRQDSPSPGCTQFIFSNHPFGLKTRMVHMGAEQKGVADASSAPFQP